MDSARTWLLGTIPLLLNRGAAGRHAHNALADGAGGRQTQSVSGAEWRSHFEGNLLGGVVMQQLGSLATALEVLRGL